MPSERVQRQIDRLLDEADEAAVRHDWQTVRDRANAALAFDPDNADATAYLAAADRGAQAVSAVPEPPAPRSPSPSTQLATPAQPTAFANGRYEVKRFLGEGGKKKVYLAHDSLLDRDVAFALIKTEGLDEAARERITREAQAMGRLGAHPHIVTVFDIGEEDRQPYLVLPVLAGGDVEGVIEKAPEHKLPLEQAIRIAVETCQGLEFVHGKGIVHRDLKPGNVWLTEDGRAMIGDFGLAVAMDRTRLTQAGMMVGTVSYMPPEQAMGGEITPRSDLYALGAMLYEMVCGRPPFVGDESVAIIGQHLNTPPVAPSWHRPDCPSALEALILRLLEKDPGRRPESAAEVQTALQAIANRPSSAVGATLAVAPGDGAGASPAPTSQADPLYRRTFVGRENEVKQLQQAFDGAMSGNGALVMVVGEPGIGKTALCEQLATYVALRGGKALVGHCYEEGSLSLPYLAFVEAMRSYVLARDPDGLRSDLGTGAADVARIVSEVRDRVQGVELRPAGDPEDDRWRLLQAITSFLRNAATVQPLCIVLEDLHWADRGTLDLLLHVSRNLQGARLLVVGTYRDVEVDRSHPLSNALGELRRINTFLRVPLRGLTVDEVHRMYEAVRGQEVPWGQAELVHRQTEGNPLFVQEVLRYLVEEGIVVREGDRYVAKAPGEGVPEGLRDVIGRRLSHLSEQTNQVLSIASVIGRDFSLAVLQRVAGTPEDEVLAALEEATARSIIEQRPATGSISFRFTHAFFRQTLYEEIFAPRRIRWHQQVGRAMEEVYARRLEEHAAELAEHFAQSTEASDLEKAVRYGELAAQRAVNVFAYGEAVRHLDQALRAQEVLDPEDITRRCGLTLHLCHALVSGGEPRQFLDDFASRSYSEAQAIGRGDWAAEICYLAFLAIMAFYGGGGWDTVEAEQWARAADRVAVPNTPSRVWANAALGRVNGATENFDEARDLFSRAISLARSLKANNLLWFAIGMTFWEAGRSERFYSVLDEQEELRRRSHQPNLEVLSYFRFAMPHLGSGELDAAIEILEQMESKGRQLNLDRYAASAWPQTLLRILMYRGQHHLLLNRIEELGADRPILLLFVALVRQEGERARALLYEGQRSMRGEAGVGRQIATLEAATALGELEIVRDATDAYEKEDDLLFATRTWLGCIPRIVGDGLAFLGDGTRARSSYSRALHACEVSGGNRPELALSRLGLAEVLLDYYPDEHDAAIEHLDFAIAELCDMKMQPALERALRHRGLLKA